MVVTGQRLRHKNHSLANLGLRGGGHRQLHKSPVSDAKPSHRSLRWISILVVCILLWFAGVDWRTLVMIAAAAAMFVLGIDQLKNAPKR